MDPKVINPPETETEASQPSPSPASDHGTDRYLAAAERGALIVLFLAIIVFFSINSETSDTFATKANLDNVLNTQAVLAITALASMFPLICGRFDLSVGAVLGLSSIVTGAILQDTGLPLVVAVAGGIATGCVIGVINGIIIVKANVNAFITTLGTATVIAGVAVLATNNTPITNGIPETLINLGTGVTLGLPTVAFVLLGVAAIVFYVVERTPYGRYLYAVGSSEPAARLVGIRTDRTVLLAFVVSGGLAGAAGVMQLAQSGAGDATVGPGFTLPAIAAAFLGATAIKPGQFNVVGTILAIFFLAALLSGLTLMGVENWIQNVVNGTALVLGVAGSTLMARQRLTS